jgi:hypothetical protein
MRSIFIAAVLLASLISLGAPMSDCRIYMDPDCMRGEWKDVKEVAIQGTPGLFYRDTAIWRIGLDSVADQTYQYRKGRMSLVIKYPRGGSDYGLMWQGRGTDMRERMFEGDASWLILVVRLGLPGAGRESGATFCRISQDTLLADFDGRRVTLIR